MSIISIKVLLKKHRLFFIPFVIFCGVLLFYFGANTVLAYFNLQFTNYTLYIVFAVCVLLAISMFLYGIVLCFKKYSVNALYRIGRLLTVCLLCAFLFSLTVIIAFGYKPIHIVEKDGKKYIANVTITLSMRYVKYYDYNNLFVCGKQVRIKEDYQEGTDDPLKLDDENLNTVISAVYYDEDGHIVRYYERPNDGIYRPY